VYGARQPIPASPHGGSAHEHRQPQLIATAFDLQWQHEAQRPSHRSLGERAWHASLASFRQRPDRTSDAPAAFRTCGVAEPGHARRFRLRLYLRPALLARWRRCRSFQIEHETVDDAPVAAGDLDALAALERHVAVAGCGLDDLGDAFDVHDRGSGHPHEHGGIEYVRHE
jgi:hypothetical protein